MRNTTSVNPPLQACQTWSEARNVCCFCSQKPQKTCISPSFQYFSLSWNRTQVTQRKCAAWWAIWRQIGGAGKSQLSWLVEALCRDFRQHDEEEPMKLGVRTLYLNMPEVEMADRMCGGYCKTAKRLTSREVRLIVDYLGEPPGSPQLPNNMWNRMESYCNVLNRMIAACACRTFVVWLESAQKIIFPVGEKYFSNWRKKVL